MCNIGDGLVHAFRASRFSRMKVPCLLGVFDLAGSRECSQYAFRHSYNVGILIFKHYAAQYPPARAPVSASRPALRLSAHDSGPVRLARPSPYGSFIHTSMPVYPGAQEFASKQSSGS